ncbi:MAG: imidazolonepropionase [Saprospiraceae bacterium]|nr:imidazolonepropionase [Saprospiraceae bacterium]
MSSYTLLGPFKQIVTMENLPLKGPIENSELKIQENGGILIKNETIVEVGPYDEYVDAQIENHTPLDGEYVALPGFIDCHTHICFAGNRFLDFEDRNSGVSYLDISKRGGGIWSTVENTRKATEEDLLLGMIGRLETLKQNGITTVEVKSGYGLSVKDEMKMLNVIKKANSRHQLDIIPTCLAAHIVPREFPNEKSYLDYLISELVPNIKRDDLCTRFDIFIEESAFTRDNSKSYLNYLKQNGFDITIHGDQFHTGGSLLAIECGAVSVDHLETSGNKEISALAKSDVVAVGLPGASIGIGCDFLPARKLLDEGVSLAIASDWNPGSAPQGNLLAQASILATYEKLSAAEVFAGITYRAAGALKIKDRGRIASKYAADIVAFQCHDYRQILYHQGELKASYVWKNGEML